MQATQFVIFIMALAMAIVGASADNRRRANTVTVTQVITSIPDWCTATSSSPYTPVVMSTSVETMTPSASCESASAPTTPTSESASESISSVATATASTSHSSAFTPSGSAAPPPAATATSGAGKSSEDMTKAALILALTAGLFSLV
ncbi:hypothetical protein H2203_007582 [Taxawa tesnikishii (nom. ined.)]|nr:hypothetical protein H2203_007582 [Dothideales sp. JES 119]